MLLQSEMLSKLSILNLNKTVPVFINSFNRLSCLEKLIVRLEKAGMERITIVDNNSTYPPLVEYLKSIPHTVEQLHSNLGFKGFWIAELPKKYGLEHREYVYTDPDVIPSEECPDNFLDLFYYALMKYPKAEKVGFGLRLDNLPDCYARKKEVIERESGWWSRPLEEHLYWAGIDTTFAMYRKGISVHSIDNSIRTGFPYVAEHDTWYQDSNNPSEEDLFYLEAVAYGMSNWTGEKGYWG